MTKPTGTVRERGAFDAYGAAALTGALTGMLKAADPGLGPTSPVVLGATILYAATLALVWLSTADPTRRLRRLAVCGLVACIGLFAGALATRAVDDRQGYAARPGGDFLAAAMRNRTPTSEPLTQASSQRR